MREEILLRFPSSVTPLEELNLPAEVIESVAGRTVKVEVLPEEPAFARQLERPDEGLS